MSVYETYFCWRKQSAQRPYLYNAARPALSFGIAVLAYLGGMFALSAALVAWLGDGTPTLGLFSKPYFGPLAMWIGACSWWAERREWQKFVANHATDVMLGPVEEFGGQK